MFGDFGERGERVMLGERERERDWNRKRMESQIEREVAQLYSTHDGRTREARPRPPPRCTLRLLAPSLSIARNANVSGVRE